MDQTLPRNRLIAFYGLLAVLALASLKPAFDWYYDAMLVRASAASLERSNDLAQVNEARERWASALSEGPMPIDRAIDELNRRGRLAFPQIRPQRSDDTAALTGWAHLPEGRRLVEAAGEEGLDEATGEPAPATAAEGADEPDAAGDADEATEAADEDADDDDLDD